MLKKKTVLIIDDDARNIFALSAVLKSRGFTCLSVHSAIDGIQLLEHNKEINVVLIDMMMPEMDGYQAIKAIRRSKLIAAIPVIAVTAQAMQGDKEKSIEAGADGYVSKPVDIDELMKLLDRL